MLSKNKLVVS